MKILFIVLHIIISFALMAVVLFQSSKSQGLSGSIAGGAETFFGKNKGKTMDGVLAKATVVLAILFVATSITLSIITQKEAPIETEVPPVATEEMAETAEGAGEEAEGAVEEASEEAVEGAEEAVEATEETTEDAE